MKHSKFLAVAATLAGLSLSVPAAHAGPFILAGTDADDHGSASGNTNQDGWLFMQKVLENLAPNVTNGNKVVVSLGSDPSTQAGDAAASAFNNSALPGSGWTFLSVNGSAAITSFLTGTGTGTITAAGIIMLDSADNVVGGLDGSELSAISTDATAVNTFVGNGGGLFSQANGYAWLSALGLGVTVTGESDQGISLTQAGNSAFPGLSDNDLSAGPYHEVFGDLGNLPILGTSNFSGNPVIIGASSGSITDPEIPEPATLALVGTGLLGLAGLRRRRKG